MNRPPPVRVLRAFGIASAPTRLAGGRGRTWRAGDIVLKPCDDQEEWRWLAEHLPTVTQDGFRLAERLKTQDGRWDVEGWCAQTVLSGSHPTGDHWAEVLAACDRFHRAARILPRPPSLHARTDPWSVGDRTAWGEATVPDHPLVRTLANARRMLDLPPQFVHGDMTNNVLFDSGTPGIIDIAPYWRPAGFANAIVVADAMCWHAADPSMLLDVVAHLREFPQLLVRALLYRMTTTIESAAKAVDLDGYRSAVDWTLRLAEDR